MIIQTITLDGVFGRWWGIHRFTKMTDDNGNVIEYSHDSKRGLTEEEMNKEYKSLLKIGTGMKRKIETKNITIDEYIDNLEKSIDQYVEYIDNGKQYREAVESNRKIRERIEQFKALQKKGVK